MNSISELPEEEFDRKLTGLSVKMLQVLALGMAVMPLLLAGVVIYLGMTGWGPGEAPKAGVALAHLVTGAHLAVLMIVVPIVWGGTLAKFRVGALESYARTGISGGEESRLTDPADIALHLVRLEVIMPLAALEGAALLGIVACFLAINEGSIHHSALYWLNLLTTGLLLLRVVLAFPGRDRMRAVFIRNVKKRAP